MNIITQNLPSEWRKRAEYLRESGADQTAHVWELAANQLEKALAASAEESLTLVEAARVSGYTADHLGLLVKKGTIPNAGRTGAPRIRRSDLPQKGTRGRRPKPKSVSAVESVDVLRAVSKLRRKR